MAPKGTPSMVAAPFEFQSRPTLPKLKRTPEGWSVFELVCLSHMNSALRSFIQDQFIKGQLKPSTADEIEAYDLVYNGMIERLADHPDLIALIADKCDSGNGVQAIAVLRSKFAGNSPAKSLTIVAEVVNKDLGVDTLAGAKRMIELNKQLPADEQFTPKLLAFLVLQKLPSSFSTMRDSAITTKTTPSLDSLIDAIEQLTPFVAGGLSANAVTRFPSRTICFNCGVTGHASMDCQRERVDCDACGPKAGHLAQFCLVKNGKDMPLSFTDAQRARIMQKRAEYAKTKGSSANTAEIDSEITLNIPPTM